MFILSHFSNHALGLVSLAAMESGRDWLLAPWRHLIGETLLLFALLAHWMLGLWLIYRRRTLRMPIWEATQIAFGLAVPPLLVYHLLGLRHMSLTHGTDDLYTRIVLFFWVHDQSAGLRQLGLFAVAWIHGCMGIHFWLRIRPAYRRLFPALLTAAVLIPTLGLLGITQAGREVSELASNPGFLEKLNGAKTVNSYGTANSETASDGYGDYSSSDSDASSNNSYDSPNANANADAYGSYGSYGNNSESESDERLSFTTAQLRDGLLYTVWGLLALTLIARFIREHLSRSHSTVRVRYLSGPEIQIPTGWTLLEASRSAGIPHASVCGGRARCSTCRVRIAGDPQSHPAPENLEKRVLERIQAAPNVRLACQLRPEQDLTVTPLLPVAIGAGNLTSSGSARGGQEREIAVLFADLRGFTRVAERKLPYDVVFLLNRYFEAVGGAVAQAGGIANQYTGDGVMALFGVTSDSRTACRQAIDAAGSMISRIEALSEVLGAELESPLRLGIGIHIGPVVVGEMGYAGTRYLTAVGDTVNTTSRLEALTKEYSCELVISEDALNTASVSAEEYPHHELALRNRDAPLKIVVIDDARHFASRLDGSTSSPPR